MSRIVTDWVLELGESKAGLQELIADVDRYNTSIKKAADVARTGFSQSYQAQLQYNQQLVASVQQQSAVAKGMEAGLSVAKQATEAEKQRGKASSEAAEASKKALDENRQKQEQLTLAINASAAASERAKAGGSQLGPTVSSALPVPAPIAVSGAVPSGAATAVTEEFARQIALAREASVAAQQYLQGVNAAAAGAKQAAADANTEASETKAIYTENLQALKALQKQEETLSSARSAASPGEPWLRANAALDANLAKQQQLKPIVAESKVAYQDAAQAAVKANEELVRQADLQRNAKQLVSETATAQKDLEGAAKAAVAAANQQARATGLIGQAEQKLNALVEQRKQAQSKPEIEAINKEISALNKEIDTYKKLGQAQSGSSGGGGFFGGVLGSLGATAAAFLTVNKLMEVFSDGLRNAAQLNGIKSAFTALTGSAQGGADEFQFLTNKADELGLKLIETADSYKLLFAAAKQAGLSVNDTREIFSAITAEAKVLGISNQKLEGSLRAVSQMLSKGKVSAEELRGQLGEALPDATGLAAKALGVTTQELDKMLQKGQIISADFLPKFAAEIKKTYGDATGDAAVQLQANLNRISNAYESFTAGLVTTFAPVISALGSLLTATDSAVVRSDKLVAAYKNESAATANLVDNIKPLYSRYEELEGTTNRNASQQSELDSVIQELAKNIPSAVTEFDKYGKALGLNSKAIQDNIDQQQRLTEYNNKTRLKENSDALKQLIADQEKYQGQVALLNKTEQETGKRLLPKGATQGGEIIYFTPEETAQIIGTAGKQIAQIQKDIEANLNNRQILRGKNPFAIVAQADVEDVQGLIERLRAQIKELTELREQVNTAPKSVVNAGGEGSREAAVAKITAYNKEIVDLQKQLDELLGKEGKKAEDKRLAALRRLQAEELKLRKNYEKALLDNLKDEGQARAAEQLRQDFNELAEAEKQIKALELAYRKVGGRGTNADGKVNTAAQQNLDNARYLAVVKYNEEIDRINREYIARRLDLQADSDEKEVAQLRAKFAEEIRIAEKSNEAVGLSLERAAALGNTTLALSLGASKIASDEFLKDLRIAAVEQERLLLRQQALADIDRDQEAQTNGINSGGLPIRQSGMENEDAGKQLNFIQRLYRRLTTLEVDLEIKKQKALLQVQIEGNNRRLQQYENDFTKEAMLIKSNLIDANKDLNRKLLFDLKEPKGRKFDLMKFLGVAKEDQEEASAAIQQAGSLIVAQISAFAQAQVEAANLNLEARRSDLDERRSELDTELALNKQGFASNVELRRAEVEDAKNARNQALEDQKKAMKAQQALETVQQTIGLISSSVDIIRGFSKIPVIGLPLGIAAVTALFGFFLAAKAKAAGATKLEKGGLHGGQRHASGGNKYMSVDGNSSIEIEEGEFTVNRNSTRKHLELIEAVNEDNTDRIQLLALRTLLKGTGVRLAADVSKRVQRNHGAVAREYAQPSQDYTPVLRKIEQNTAPKVVTYETETHRVIVDGNHTRRILKR